MQVSTVTRHFRSHVSHLRHRDHRSAQELQRPADGRGQLAEAGATRSKSVVYEGSDLFERSRCIHLFSLPFEVQLLCVAYFKFGEWIMEVAQVDGSFTTKTHPVKRIGILEQLKYRDVCR